MIEFLWKKSEDTKYSSHIFIFLKSIYKQMTRRKYIKLLPVFDSRLVNLLLYSFSIFVSLNNEYTFIITEKQTLPFSCYSMKSKLAVGESTGKVN